jgi:hypothetical protein
MQVVGTSASKEQMAQFFSNSPQAFEQWELLSERIASRTRDYNAMTSESTRDMRVSVIREIEQMKEEAEKLLPKKGWFTRVSEATSAAGITSPTPEQFAFAPTRYIEDTIKLEGFNKQLKYLEDNTDQTTKATESYLKTWKGIRTEIDRIKAGLDGISRGVPEVMADAFSSVGGSVESVLRLPKKKRDSMFGLAEKINEQKLLAADPTEPLDVRAFAQAEADNLLKPFEKVFDTPEVTTIFDRFSELAQKSGLDVTLESWITLSGRARSAVKNLMETAAAQMSRLNNTPGVFPGTEAFESGMASIKAARDKVAAIMATASAPLQELVSAGVEAAGVSLADFFRMPRGTVTAVTNAERALRVLKAERDSISTGDRGDPTGRLAEVNALIKAQEDARRKLLLAGDAKAASSFITDKLGVTVDSKFYDSVDSAKFATLLSLANDVVDVESRAASTQEEWLANYRKRMGLQKQAAALVDSSVQRTMNEVGLEGDPSAVLSNIAMRKEFLSLLEDIVAKQEEYNYLSSLRDSGTANQDQLDRLGAINKLRGKVGSAIETAELDKPIRNMSEMAEKLGVDLKDLATFPAATLTSLVDNRKEIDRLYADIKALGKDEVEQLKEKSRLLAIRLEKEAEVTKLIEDRKSITDTVKSAFSDGIKSWFRGDGTLSSIFLKISDMMTDTLLEKVSDRMFSGFAKSMGKIMAPDSGLLKSLGLDKVMDYVGGLFGEKGPMSAIGGLFRKDGMFSFIGDMFGGEGLGELGTFSNPMWVQLKEAFGLGEGGIKNGLDDPGALGEDGGIFDGIGAKIDELTGGMFSKFTDMFSGFGDMFGDLFKNLGSGLSSLFGGGSGGGFDWGSLLSGGLSLLGIPGFDTGGVVGGSIGSPQLALVHGGETILPTHKKKASDFASTTVNLTITGDISRQTRKEVMSMLPAIAAGVNSNNRENNYRR